MLKDLSNGIISGVDLLILLKLQVVVMTQIDTLDSTEFISTSLAIACADLNTWETAVSFIYTLTLVLIKSPEVDGCVCGCGPRKIYK